MKTIQVYDPPHVLLCRAVRYRRVVLGGFGVLSSKGTSGDSGLSCGPGCGCH
jgi:hypothetical protein